MASSSIFHYFTSWRHWDATAEVGGASFISPRPVLTLLRHGKKKDKTASAAATTVLSRTSAGSTGLTHSPSEYDGQLSDHITVFHTHGKCKVNVASAGGGEVPVDRPGHFGIRPTAKRERFSKIICLLSSSVFSWVSMCCFWFFFVLLCVPMGFSESLCWKSAGLTCLCLKRLTETETNWRSWHVCVSLIQRPTGLKSHYPNWPEILLLRRWSSVWGDDHPFE